MLGHLKDSAGLRAGGAGGSKLTILHAAVQTLILICSGTLN